MRADLFDAVDEAMETAKLVAYDGCHKIYLAMDDIEAAWFRAEYPQVVEDTVEVMGETVRRWFDESCSLRFVNAVHHNAEDPNAGFISLIGQFEDVDDAECNTCGTRLESPESDYCWRCEPSTLDEVCAFCEAPIDDCDCDGAE